MTLDRNVIELGLCNPRLRNAMCKTWSRIGFWQNSKCPLGRNQARTRLVHRKDSEARAKLDLQFFPAGKGGINLHNRRAYYVIDCRKSWREKKVSKAGRRRSVQSVHLRFRPVGMSVQKQYRARARQKSRWTGPLYRDCRVCTRFRYLANCNMYSLLSRGINSSQLVIDTCRFTSNNERGFDRAAARADGLGETATIFLTADSCLRTRVFATIKAESTMSRPQVANAIEVVYRTRTVLVFSR